MPRFDGKPRPPIMALQREDAGPAPLPSPRLLGTALMPLHELWASLIPWLRWGWDKLWKSGIPAAFVICCDILTRPHCGSEGWLICSLPAPVQSRSVRDLPTGWTLLLSLFNFWSSPLI